jgi:hypothetical protein
VDLSEGWDEFEVDPLIPRIFQRFPLPFVLQKDGSNGEYLVVGICYVYGAMDGEILQKGLDMQEILLR